MACSMALHLGLPAGFINLHSSQEGSLEVEGAQGLVVNRTRALWSIVMLDR